MLNVMIDLGKTTKISVGTNGRNIASLYRLKKLHVQVQCWQSRIISKSRNLTSMYNVYAREGELDWNLLQDILEQSFPVPLLWPVVWSVSTQERRSTAGNLKKIR